MTAVACRHVLAVLCAMAWAGSAAAQGVPPSQAKDLVVVVKGEKLYHEPSCPVVKGIKSPAVTLRKRAEYLGIRPHDCQAASKAALASDATRLVWVDLTTKRYHLAGCSLIGVPRAQVSLAHAAASYGPCNACKPPAK